MNALSLSLYLKLAHMFPKIPMVSGAAQFVFATITLYIRAVGVRIQHEDDDDDDEHKHLFWTCTLTTAASVAANSSRCSLIDTYRPAAQLPSITCVKLCPLVAALSDFRDSSTHDSIHVHDKEPGHLESSGVYCVLF